MSKNIIKGAEKCLSQDCMNCELGGRIWMVLDVFGCVWR